MTQASNRDKVILTQGQEEHFDLKDSQAALEEKNRKVSNLTHPQGQAIEEVKEDSLQSYQFSGSQFGNPSDGGKPDFVGVPGVGADHNGEGEGQNEYMYSGETI